MNRFISFCKKNKARLWFSALLNLVILVLLLMLCVPIFETNDDAAMRNMIKGYSGAPSPYIIYMNYILGTLLVALYNFSVAIPWYEILFYIFIFCSLTGITYVFLNRKCTVFSVSILVIFLAFFGFEGYVLLQFTRVASLLTASGMLLILWGIIEQPKNTGGIVWFGILLSFLGTLVRFNQALLIIAIMSSIGVALILSKKEMVTRVYIKKLGFCLLCVLAVLVAAYGTDILNDSKYTGEEWDYYKAFNSARSVILDYGIPGYEEIAEELSEIGISEADLKLLKSWTFEDWDVFSLETMQTLAALRQPTSISIPTLDHWRYTLVRGVWDIPTFYCFLLFFLLWILFGKHEKAHILSVAYLCVVILAIYFYLHFFLNRILQPRVDYGIYLSACLCLMLFMKSEGKWLSKKIWTPIAALAIIFSFAIGDHYLHIRLWNPPFYNQELLDSLEVSAADKDHLYMTKTITEANILKPYTADKRLFTSHPEPSTGINIYGLGGWNSRLPLNNQRLSLYGITNPIRDMVDNEKVYFVGPDYTDLISFIEAHYGNEVDVQLVKYIGNTPIYRFVSIGIAE